jgi:hypothetical protein
VTGPIRASDLERTRLLTLAERYLDLEIRDFVARHAADDRDHLPIAVGEHLELLAAGEAIRWQVSGGRQAAAYQSRQAGAIWQAIADTSGVSVADARGDFLRWIAGQGISTAEVPAVAGITPLRDGVELGPDWSAASRMGVAALLAPPSRPSCEGCRERLAVAMPAGVLTG